MEEEAGVAEAEEAGVAEEVGTGEEAVEVEGVGLETGIVEEALGTEGGTVGMETGEGIVMTTEAGTEIEEGREGSNQRDDRGADPQQTVPEGEMNQGGIQEIRDLSAIPWIILRQGGQTSQEQGGHRRQRVEAQWGEGARKAEGGMRGGREGWTKEGRAVEATVGDQDQDTSERGDSQMGMEGSDQLPPQAKAIQGVSVRGNPLEGTEERHLLQELMEESQPQVMESQGVLGVHQGQDYLHLLKRLLLCHIRSSRQERKQQDWLQKGVSC